MPPSGLACACFLALLALAAAQEDANGSLVAQQQPPAAATAVEPAQMIITPAPIMPVGCVTYSEAAMRAGSGLLCASQFFGHNVTKIICNDFKPECKETVTEWQLLDPAAPGAPADSYAQSAVAACRIMGYSTFGSGSTHMVGPTKDTCYNGKAWSSDNWWTTLVCCK